MTQAPKKTLSLAFALGMQIFLLRRGWMGGAGDYIMIITTKGRKTGKKRSVPISYLKNGDEIIAFNNRGISNWYRNLKADPRALLEIKGEKIEVTASLVTEDAESRSLFSAYKSDPGLFERLMRLPADAPEADLEKARAPLTFVRFRPVQVSAPAAARQPY